jgi:hypothetical protein
VPPVNATVRELSAYSSQRDIALSATSLVVPMEAIHFVPEAERPLTQRSRRLAQLGQF